MSSLTDISEALYKLGYNSTLKAFIQEVLENQHYQKVQYAEYHNIMAISGRLAMEEAARDAETKANQQREENNAEGRGEGQQEDGKRKTQKQEVEATRSESPAQADNCYVLYLQAMQKSFANDTLCRFP